MLDSGANMLYQYHSNNNGWDDEAFEFADGKKFKLILQFMINIDLVILQAKHIFHYYKIGNHIRMSNIWNL